LEVLEEEGDEQTADQHMYNEEEEEDKLHFQEEEV
jgi:hypothetical protein